LARALAMAVAQAGASSIVVASRSPTSGQRLVELIQNNRSDATLIEFGDKKPIKIDQDITLLVSATSLSTLNPNAPLPMDATAAGSEGIVVDVAYNSPATWLTRAASKRGCRIIAGVDLYVRQTAIALSTWTGTPTDLAAMHDAAEEFLGL
jgi:shikimate 5-dehydrogenase